MIALLKSTREINIDLTKPDKVSYIYCELTDSVQTESGYTICGNYYYNTEDGQKIVLESFSRYFINSDLNNLYLALNITYPQGRTYTQRRTIDLETGLKYVLTIEPIFGLTGGDWE